MSAGHRNSASESDDTGRSGDFTDAHSRSEEDSGDTSLRETVRQLRAMGATVDENGMIVSQLPFASLPERGDDPIRADSSQSTLSSSFAPGGIPGTRGGRTTTAMVTSVVSSIEPKSSNSSKSDGSKRHEVPSSSPTAKGTTPGEYPVGFVAPSERFFSPAASLNTNPSSTFAESAMVTSLRSNFSLTTDDTASTAAPPRAPGDLASSQLSTTLMSGGGVGDVTSVNQEQQ